MLLSSPKKLQETHSPLRKENAELKDSVQGLKREALKLEVLPSPLEEVTASLLALAGDPTLTKAQTQALRHAIDLLTGDSLFVPDVEKKIEQGNFNVDMDTKVLSFFSF